MKYYRISFSKRLLLKGVLTMLIILISLYIIYALSNWNYATPKIKLISSEDGFIKKMEKLGYYINIFHDKYYFKNENYSNKLNVSFGISPQKMTSNDSIKTILLETNNELVKVLNPKFEYDSISYNVWTFDTGDSCKLEYGEFTAKTSWLLFSEIKFVGNKKK